MTTHRRAGSPEGNRGSDAARESRPKFDTLFADPRHYRGDCRLARTAIRRGWLNDVPQADRDALVARFEQATQEREAAGFASEGQRVRAIFAEARLGIEIEQANQRAERWEWQAECFGKATANGRPRWRWYVTDFAHRIDANAIGHRARAAGIDPRTLYEILVRCEGRADQRVSLAPSGRDLDRARVYLWCPKCNRPRQYLYVGAAGVRCRGCGGITYRG